MGSVLRPFVYFNRPKSMDMGTFIENNPMLGEITDNFNMQQRDARAKQYDPIFDIHELSKNYSLGEQSKFNVAPYVQYIGACLNLYAHVCIGGNDAAIKAVIDSGTDESHILCALTADTTRLTVHEQLKQNYMQLGRVLFIDNTPPLLGINQVNRCYSWAAL